jgi:ParB family chromosome partitioning protein
MKKETKTITTKEEQMQMPMADKSAINGKPELKTNISKTVEENMKNEIITNIPISKLMEFENHPFKVREDAEFQKLKDSIAQNGIVVPTVARPKNDGYELISGHRRKHACQHLGIEVMPVIIRDLSDEQAVFAMIESNVQRENILPSEKAYAYKMKLEALNRQGNRSDLTSTPVVSKIRTNEMVGVESGDSREQVRRYVRLTELTPQLLQLVDSGKIAFRPAVELSYLTREQQELLLSAMDAEQSTPSLSQAQKLKSMSVDGKLMEDTVMEIMREQKCNQKEQLRISYDKIKDIIKKDVNPKEIEEMFIQFLLNYQKRLNKQKSQDAR